MTLSVAGSILVTVPLGPLETQIEPKPASTSRGVDCLICATSLPTGTGRETLVEEWPQEATDMNAMMVRTAFNCRQPTLEHYSASTPCAATRIRAQTLSSRQIWLLWPYAPGRSKERPESYSKPGQERGRKIGPARQARPSTSDRGRCELRLSRKSRVLSWCSQA